jgi:hypothetical protein
MNFYQAMMSKNRQALAYYLEAFESKWCLPLYKRFVRAQINLLRDPAK